MNSLMEVFSIKIKIKSTLKNINENTCEQAEIYAIKNKDKITYIINNTTYKIEIKNKKISVIRENEDFIHIFNFDIDKITKSEYYIKELNTSIEVLVKTNNLELSDKNIKIAYEIVDNNEKYVYNLDLE